MTNVETRDAFSLGRSNVLARRSRKLHRALVTEYLRGPTRHDSGKAAASAIVKNARLKDAKSVKTAAFDYRLH
ncbi:hypothetical protein [Paraburkholderia gardini]|uniref:hypothetical protein n=1 Tax=Paraburkholderia gardini TaxID=2823469 RepID=UPI001E5F306A|nr:hypothetical protein [Paraburkholderia gardini]